MNHLTKEEILSEIKERKNEFTKEELLEAVGQPGHFLNTLSSEDANLSRQKFLSVVAYSIGALIVILGVVLLGMQFWSDLSVFIKISITFGLGIVLYLLTVFLENGKYKSPTALKTALAIISAFLTMVGFFVTTYEVSNLGPTPLVHTLITFLLILMFGSLYKIRKSQAYMFFVIFFATWFVYALISLNIIQNIVQATLTNPGTIYLYLTSIIGLSFISLAYMFLEQQKIHRRLSLLLYFVGSLALIIPFFSLSYMVTKGFDIISVSLIFGLIVTGAFLQRKTLAVSGSVLLAIFVMISSARYFADTIGWPFALIIAGFLIMAAGYLSYTLFSKISKG